MNKFNNNCAGTNTHLFFPLDVRDCIRLAIAIHNSLNIDFGIHECMGSIANIDCNPFCPYPKCNGQNAEQNTRD